MLQSVKRKLIANWNRLTLRRQLVLSLWLCTIPISAAGSALVLDQAYQRAIAEIRQTMAFNLGTLAQVMTNWLEDQQAWLGQLAEGPSIRSLDPISSRELLQRAKTAYPKTDLSLYRRDGQLIATNASVKPTATPTGAERRRRSTWFQKALLGDAVVELWQPNSATALLCVSQAEAVHRGNVVIGVLQACAPPDHVAQSSGVGALLNTTITDGRQQGLDLDRGIKQGLAILMLSNQGQLAILNQQGEAVTSNGKLTSFKEIQNSGWGNLVDAIQRLQLRPNLPTQSRYGNYFITALPFSSSFKLASVVDYSSSLKATRKAVAGIAAANLLALLISSLAIARVSKPLLKPIDQAGDALRQISDGNFDIHLPTSTNNDIGRLFGHIQQASNQLKTYLAEATHHAITESQLQEARRIQAGFLIKDLPASEQVSLAASFDPAYEIGADWYDAIAIQKTIYFVVADVCDKGIPSALYMSVFRSLLRHSLINEAQDNLDSALIINKALSTVNNYMAQNHGDTAMFATVFVGAYEQGSQQLNYIVAGHEQPLLLRGQELETLQLGGPAVGLFPNVAFTTRQCPMPPGAALLAYSDGLPDARDPAGNAFGKENIAAALRADRGSRAQASELLHRVRDAVQAHMAGAQPFDDLTLLVIKAQESP